MIFTIYVMGNNILYGYLGMVSFGQPFYMGVGAYCTAIYIAYLGVNPLTGILMGIIGGLIIGVVLGPFFIRLRGGLLRADQRGYLRDRLFHHRESASAHHTG